MKKDFSIKNCPLCKAQLRINYDTFNNVSYFCPKISNNNVFEQNTAIEYKSIQSKLPDTHYIFSTYIFKQYIIINNYLIVNNNTDNETKVFKLPIKSQDASLNSGYIKVPFFTENQIIKDNFINRVQSLLVFS
jgi:hypothetical protein